MGQDAYDSPHFHDPQQPGATERAGLKIIWRVAAGVLMK